MRKIRRVIAIFLLIIIYSYVINVTNFPNKVLVYQDSKIDFKLCPFVNLNGEILVNSDNKKNTYQLNLSLGKIPLKNVEVKIAEKLQVVPIREINWA